MDFIPLKTKLKPVGRLDQNTTGLLLLTNDGMLQDYLTHPKNQISKDYEVIIEGKISGYVKVVRTDFNLDYIYRIPLLRNRVW